MAKDVVDLLFPSGTPSRIPIVAVTGSNGKTTTTRMISYIFKGMGRSVGMTTTDGIYIDERLVKRADASGPKSAQMVLQNPRIDFAVFETARGGILREGLGYGKNDVAVVLNVTGDHLGLKGIDSLEQLAAVKQVVVEAVPRTGFAVLNADDELVAGMRKACSGSVILFSMQERNELVDRWVRRGGKAVVLEKGPRGEMMVIKEAAGRCRSHGCTRSPPRSRDARMMVQNAMAAAAAAHAAGAHLHDIRQGLRSFTTSIYQAPGRLNVFDLDGVKGDRLRAQRGGARDARRLRGTAHDRRAERRPAWAGVVEREPARRGGRDGGDRRDEDMRQLGRVAARYFDDVIIREDRNPRGRRGRDRRPDPRGGPRGDRVGRACRQRGDRRRRDGRRAQGSRSLAPGDLVVLCVDHATEVFKELERRRSLAAPSIFTEGNGHVEQQGGDPDMLGV